MAVAMKFLAAWPIEDATIPDADLITEAIADLPNVKPEGWNLRGCVWSIEGGHVLVSAEAEEETFRCGHPKHGDNVLWKTDNGRRVRRCRTCNRRQEDARRPRRTCACGAPCRYERCRSCANKQRNLERHAREKAEREAFEAELAEIDWEPVQWQRRGLIWVAA